MIDLYSWSTPNGWKASIMLEELGVPYKLHPIDISKGMQHTPEYLRVNPNNKIPAIVDEGVAIFESAAILIYLAEKYGRFLPTSGPNRYRVLEWLAWQVAGVGPMFGQLGHFTMQASTQIPYAIERFLTESRRLLKVLDHDLQSSEYIAGDYSIADMATYPWTVMAIDRAAQSSEYGAVRSWLQRVGQRPAVQKGMITPPRSA